MDWKDGLTAAAIVGVGLFGVKTIRDTQYRNYLVNKFGDRNAETFEARGTWNLYKSQEKVLKAYRDSGGNANDYDSLPIDIVNKLESIRNSETLWSDVNRWLWDNPSKNKNPYGFHSMWDAESFSAHENYTVRMDGFEGRIDPITEYPLPTFILSTGTEKELKDGLYDFMIEDRLETIEADSYEEAEQKDLELWNKRSLEAICDDNPYLSLVDIANYDEYPYSQGIYHVEKNAESFSADSISICGVCSVAGHRHCGQTTGCPCCEIRVKKESQRPTCGDCGELKSSTPQEYNQWTCWPCTNAVDWHGNNCYCQTCMAETDESFSADSKTESCSCGMDNCSNHTEWMPCAECGIRSKGVSLNINTCDPCSEMVWMQKNIDEIRTKIKENYRFQKEHDKEFPFYETRLGAESYSAESMCKYCKINDPENCMYFGPTCLDAESHAYSYAYNEGHSDSRKKEEYRPNLTTARQEGDFKKILKQKGD
jgi:hypothetical protein